jgi:hypothetical protein
MQQAAQIEAGADVSRFGGFEICLFLFRRNSSKAAAADRLKGTVGGLPAGKDRAGGFGQQRPLFTLLNGQKLL